MKAPVFTPPPQLNMLTKVIVFTLFLSTSFSSLAEYYLWTGGGADSLFTTAENWGGVAIFENNIHNLTHNLNNASITATLPAGAYAQTSGFDLTNGEIVIAGKLDSIRMANFNGFWMRGNSVITLLPLAEFTFLQQAQGQTDRAQITMAGDNNLINKYDTSSLTFTNIFISAFDCGGGNQNNFNQYAGTISSNSIQLGTFTNDFATDPSMFNLYGGTVSTSTLHIQHYFSSPRNTHGRGEINIYGGEFIAGTLSGGQSISSETTYRGDINIHLSEASSAGFGTFTVTGNSDYNGNVNFLVDAPVLTSSSDILEASLANFSGNVHDDMQLSTNSSLITFSEDRKTAKLNPAKNLTPEGGYTVGTTLSFADAATEGYLSIAASHDPYKLILSTTEFGNEKEMDSFVDWINSYTENYGATALGLSSLEIGILDANADSVFLWDFSGYSEKVGVLGITSQHVPEPHTWILALLGIVFYWGKNYVQKRVYAS